MSGSESESPLLGQDLWGVWQGFRAHRTGSDTPSVPELGDEETATEAARRDESDRVHKALTFPSSGGKKCRVPGCQPAKCRLTTHQLYKPRVPARVRLRRKQGGSAGGASDQLELLNKSPEALQDNTDDFPTLPIEESSDPAIQALFHHFFCDTFDRLSSLFGGPAITNPAELKRRMLETALSSEAYCRSLLLHAWMAQNSAEGHFGESKDRLDLYDNTLKAFRAQLQMIHEEPNPVQIELALLVLCSLMVHDGASDRKDVQRLHWQGLKNLVSLRGGLHSISTALPYVIHADRSCAVLFNEMPTYNNRLEDSLLMPMPVASGLRYGIKLQDMKGRSERVHQSVLDHCIETSGLVELWEESRMQAITRQSGRVRCSLEYLYFVRDRLDERFTVLNARWASICTRDRCMLWATRLVEYSCTWSNYERAVTRHVSQQLVAALQQPEAATLWHQDTDILIWVLFALTTVELTLESQAWVLTSLHQMLSVKYDFAPWPRLWWIDEQENLLGFLWSSSRYAGKFKKICDELREVNSGSASMTSSPESGVVSNLLHAGTP